MYPYWSCASAYVCLSLAVFPRYCMDPDVTLENGRGCPLIVYYLADLQSVHGFRCYGNIARTRNVSECLCSLHAWFNVYSHRHLRNNGRFSGEPRSAGSPRFLQRDQCSHCKRCISYGNSVRPSVRLSVRPSVTRRYCVKTTARSTMQFSPLDSKMCLVL